MGGIILGGLTDYMVVLDEIVTGLADTILTQMVFLEEPSLSSI